MNLRYGPDILLMYAIFKAFFGLGKYIERSGIYEKSVQPFLNPDNTYIAN
jgi:hypothetical protein